MKKTDELDENASCDDKAKFGIYRKLKDGEKCNCLSCRRIEQIRVLLQPAIPPISSGFWSEKYGT